MRKIFIDCGSNLGQGYDQISKKENMDDTWDIFMFEPNIKCYESLKTKFTEKNIKIFNSAVSNTYKKEKFLLEYCPTQKEWVGGASNILGKKYLKPSYIKNEYIKNSEYLVDCIDLSDFIMKNFTNEDYIILKLDIEGSEFEILPKMISDNTLNFIDKIYVEWHDHLILNFNDLSFNKDYFLEEFKKLNIEYNIWY